MDLIFLFGATIVGRRSLPVVELPTSSADRPRGDLVLAITLGRIGLAQGVLLALAAQLLVSGLTLRACRPLRFSES